MRIEGIHIDGFGRFHQQPFVPLAPGLNVFCGPNEAGKSTLLAFIQAVFYGFPRQRRSMHYPPLDGGRHGGRLWLADERGRLYIVDREASAPGKDLIITLPDHSQTQSEEVLRQLLGGASKDVYTSVFSFGIAELQAIESLSGGEIGSQIYSAGIGAGAVPGALARLAAQEDGLFRHRGQKHLIAGVLGELEEVEALLQDRREDDLRFDQMERERAALDEELVQLGTEAEALLERVVLARRLRDAWPTWSRAGHLRAEIAALGQQQVEPGTVARLEAIEAALGEAEIAQADAAAARAAANAGVEAIDVDARLLSVGHLVEPVRAERTAFAASVRDLPKRQAELQAALRLRDEALAEMGPDWTLERIGRLDASNVRRATIAEKRDQRAALVAEMRRRDDQLDVARERYEECRAAHRLALADTASAPAPLSAGEAACRLGLVQACIDARDSIPATTGATGSSIVALVVAGAAAAAAAAGFLLYDHAGAALGMVSGAAGAGLLFALRAERETDRSVALRSYREALDAAGLTERELGAALRRAEQDLDRARAHEDAARRLAAAEEQLQGADQAMRRVAESRDAIAAEIDVLDAAWRDCAAAAGLDPAVTPAAALELLNQSRFAVERERQVSELAHRSAAIASDIAAYATRVAAAFQACGVPEPASPDASGAAADALIDAYDLHRERARDLAEAQQRLLDCDVQAQKAEQAVQEHRARLDRLLEANGVNDPGELRRLAEIAGKRANLQRELRECEIRLAEAGGGGEALERFQARLAEADPGRLEVDADELATDRERTGSRREALLERRGALEGALRELRAGEGMSSLLLRREKLRAKLATLVRQWCEVRAARRLVERTRRVYEAERQPRVIRAAEAYFRDMTSGRYTRVIAPLGEQTVRVGDDTGRQKTPDQLSRGTREQLYLALRFGLIDQFAERGGALPVAIDEVLVNFDPDRAREAVKGFALLAHRHQVIALTCHPWVVDLFRAADPNVRIWDLGAAAQRTAGTAAGTAPR